MAIHTEIDLLRYRRTKIVATLGPATGDAKTIARLIRAGVNVFRLNMSHGTHDDHRANYQRVRSAATKANRPVAILADLCGPKIRVGRFRDGGIDLVPGQRVEVTTRDVVGEPGLIPSQYEALALDVGRGDRILMADGVLELVVLEVEGESVHCDVVQGGYLSDRKGINLPGVDVSAPSLTDKDREDAAFAADLDVDFLALSFVRNGSDMDRLRDLVEAAGRSIALMAKIERPEALTNFDEILAASDAIMVARGDLGVELPPEQVPIAQQQLIALARRGNKPVVVATQMLESMIEHARPTRAEVADVSNSVSSGADAVMLSAETASGAHPVLAVEMMDRVCRHTEAYLWRQGAFGALSRRSEVHSPVLEGDAVARATALLSRDLKVRAVVVISEGGMSAATMSAGRPAAPVVVLSSRLGTYRRMSLYWGMIPIRVAAEDLENPLDLARDVARRRRLAKSGEQILLVRGFNREVRTNTPSVTVLTV